MNRYLHYTRDLSIGLGHEFDNRDWQFSRYYHGKWNLGSDSSVLTSMKGKVEILKEYIFEMYRAEKYPTLPSRIKCIFMFEDGADVIPILKKWGMVGVGNLLTLEMLEGTIHKADPFLLDCNSDTLNSWQDVHAKKYWAGLSSDKCMVKEVLAVGRLRVIDSKHVTV